MKLKTYTSVRQTLSIFREVYPDFPMSMALTFLEVARHNGVTVSQVQNATGLTQASASRNCRALTKQKTAKEVGLDLAVWVQNPEDLRSKLLILNDKGKALMERLDQVYL